MRPLRRQLKAARARWATFWASSFACLLGLHDDCQFSKTHADRGYLCWCDCHFRAR